MFLGAHTQAATAHTGAGSTFRVFLPAAGMLLRAPLPAKDGGGATRHKAVVLVVDDEEVVRWVAQSALLKRGFEVLLAANGEEAIEVFKANQHQVAAIVLDLTMPVMSGEEALPRLGRFGQMYVSWLPTGLSRRSANAVRPHVR